MRTHVDVYDVLLHGDVFGKGGVLQSAQYVQVRLEVNFAFDHGERLIVIVQPLVELTSH